MIPVFRVWDKKYKKWAGIRGNKGRSFSEYWREKTFKESGLLLFDLEGFAMGENGDLMLLDECGGVLYLDPGRFQICFEIKEFEKLPKSDSKTYYQLD